jgi:iron complex transport system substrate-binding protein
MPRGTVTGRGWGRWEFYDDRGRTVALRRRPERVVAYVQAAATLWDLGITSAGLFGSQHDGRGTSADPEKTGRMPITEIPYFG